MKFLCLGNALTVEVNVTFNLGVNPLLTKLFVMNYNNLIKINFPENFQPSNFKNRR